MATLLHAPIVGSFMPTSPYPRPDPGPPGPRRPSGDPAEPQPGGPNVEPSPSTGPDPRPEPGKSPGPHPDPGPDRPSTRARATAAAAGHRARALAARIRALPRPTRPQVAIALAVVAAIALVSWSRCGVNGRPDVAALAAYQHGGGPMLLDRTGKPLARLTPLARKTVAIASLPAYLPEAFIAVEDKRFRDHDGVDWRRVPGALVANVRSRATSSPSGCRSSSARSSASCSRSAWRGRSRTVLPRMKSSSST